MQPLSHSSRRTQIAPKTGWLFPVVNIILRQYNKFSVVWKGPDFAPRKGVPSFVRSNFPPPRIPGPPNRVDLSALPSYDIITYGPRPEETLPSLLTILQPAG